MNDQLKQAALEAFKREHGVDYWPDDFAMSSNLPDWKSWWRSWQLATQAAYLPAHWLDDVRRVIEKSKNKNNEYEAGRQAVMLLRLLLVNPETTPPAIRRQVELEAPAPVTAEGER